MLKWCNAVRKNEFKMLDSSSLKKMGYENHQYQGWIKNIKGVLEELKKEDQQLKRVRVCVWKKSMERVL
ncbi:MAG: hypothetical protein WAJ84_06070, partial [Candidatus Rhabdochlamydia sp.]